MKKLLFYVLTLVFICSCNTTKVNILKLKYDAPVSLNDDWVSKQPSLGIPDMSGTNTFSYFSKGIVVHINMETKKIYKIIFTWFKNSQHFSGKVYGISISDTYPKVKSLWGNENSKQEINDDYYHLTWNFAKLDCIVQIWKTSGTDNDLGGLYEAETVKRIEIISK